MLVIESLMQMMQQFSDSQRKVVFVIPSVIFIQNLPGADPDIDAGEGVEGELDGLPSLFRQSLF